MEKVKLKKKIPKTLFDKIEFYQEEIKTFLDEGYTIESITKILRDNEIAIKPETLRKYLWKLLWSEKEKDSSFKEKKQKSQERTIRTANNSKIRDEIGAMVGPDDDGEFEEDNEELQELHKKLFNRQ